MSVARTTSPHHGSNARRVVRQAPSLITLAQAQRAFQVRLRDADAIREKIICYLDQLRDLETRGRALQRDASGLRPGEVLLAHMQDHA